MQANARMYKIARETVSELPVLAVLGAVCFVTVLPAAVLFSSLIKPANADDPSTLVVTCATVLSSLPVLWALASSCSYHHAPSGESDARPGA